MKEVSSLMKESVWLDDKDINDCQGCKKVFSVSRRKVNPILLELFTRNNFFLPFHYLYIPVPTCILISIFFYPVNFLLHDNDCVYMHWQKIIPWNIKFL